MADDFGSMEIHGLDELEAKLAEMDNDMAGKALFSALNVALTPVKKEAQQKALVAKEPHIMTKKGGGKVKVQPGLLSSAIRKKRLPKSEHKGEFSQGAVMGVYVGKGTKQKEFPNYWHFAEYGTSKQQATPYLRPAFDNNIDVMIDKFSDKLAANIEKYTE